MKSDMDKCSTSRCRGSADIFYIDRWLCDDCFEKLCGDD